MSTTVFSGIVVRTTDRAVLVRFDDDNEEKWIPRSVCVDGDTLEEGDTDIEIKDWWVEKEGLG